MVIASPRASMRRFLPVPSDWTDVEEQTRIIARALRQLQDIARRYAIEVVEPTANYTMVDEDALIAADATAGNVTVTLLSAAGREGRLVEVKKTDASANLVIVDPAGSETIDGAATVSLSAQYSLCGLRSNGVNWHRISTV